VGRGVSSTSLSFPLLHHRRLRPPDRSRQQDPRGCFPSRGHCNLLKLTRFRKKGDAVNVAVRSSAPMSIRARVLARCRQLWGCSPASSGPPIGDVRTENPDRAKQIVRPTAIGEELCLAIHSVNVVRPAVSRVSIVCTGALVLPLLMSLIGLVLPNRCADGFRASEQVPGDQLSNL
jgi:hypothetical protein